MDWIEAEAPSNIALIKYMGKADPATLLKNSLNTATNASLSYTLEHLRTRVRVRWEQGHEKPFVWRPLVANGFHAPRLSEAGEARFLRHAENCLQRLSATFDGSLVVESANGFPSDCGLASSASSFAALTIAVAKLVGLDVSLQETRSRLSKLSRQGSGSSCRSLFGPWALWRDEGARPVSDLPAATQLRHLALIVDEEKKAVSSSEAHVRVTTSLLFRGRVERAEERLRLVMDQLRRAGGEGGVHAWNRAARLVWNESWDMHALFETSEPPFGYFVPDSIHALNVIRAVSSEVRDEVGVDLFREPMVTMDAGPNVHVLLWNDSTTDALIEKMKARLGGFVRILDSKEMATS